MPKPKKVGRPKLPASEFKRVFPLRLSDTERGAYEKAAAEQGMSLPEWMRTTLTKAASK